MYDAKEVDCTHLKARLAIQRDPLERYTHTAADRMFPIIVIKRMRLRPYLSDKEPIFGDTKN